MTDLQTDRKASAQRQTLAAIEFFNRGEFDCAITLAAAGEGILPPTDEPHIFKALREHASWKALEKLAQARSRR